MPCYVILDRGDGKRYSNFAKGARKILHWYWDKDILTDILCPNQKGNLKLTNIILFTFNSIHRGLYELLSKYTAFHLTSDPEIHKNNKSNPHLSKSHNTSDYLEGFSNPTPSKVQPIPLPPPFQWNVTQEKSMYIKTAIYTDRLQHFLYIYVLLWKKYHTLWGIIRLNLPFRCLFSHLLSTINTNLNQAKIMQML